MSTGVGGHEEIVMFGTGDIAEVADYYFAQDSSIRVVAFTVDAEFLAADRWLGRPVVAWSEIQQAFPPDRFGMFVAVGYNGLNRMRRAKFDEARAKGYRLASYVSTRAAVFGTFEARPNQFVLEDNTIQPFAKIGENTTLWSGNHIGHHSEIADDVFISSHVVISGGASIGPRSFIGVNATIRDGVKVGADCVIGAGALILQDIPDGSVVAPSATEMSRVPSSRLKRI